MNKSLLVTHVKSCRPDTFDFIYCGLEKWPGNGLPDCSHDADVPVWGWEPYHAEHWVDYIWEEWNGPGPLQQNPVTPPAPGTGVHSSSHRPQGPVWQKLSFMMRLKSNTFRFYINEMFKHWLTVRANMISLKFLFPTILFLIALTASLALEEGGRWYDIPRKKCPDLFCLDFLLFKCSTTIIRYKYNYRKQWCKHINNTKQGEC